MFLKPGRDIENQKKKYIFDTSQYDYFPCKVDDAIIDIFVPVYNHGKYIAQALDSILNQKTKYKYRIIVIEDCSTDNSRDIVINYYNNHQNVMCLCLAKNNTNARLTKYVYWKYSTAKYIGVIEGDDYWIDENKIEKQVSFLERHSEYVAVAGNVINVDEVGEKLHCDLGLYIYQDSHVYTKQNAYKFEQVSHASTIVKRNYYLDASEELYIESTFCCPKNGDRKVSVYLGMIGNTYYSSDIYTAHRRVFSGDSWTAKTHNKNYSFHKYKIICELRDFCYYAFGIKINIKNNKNNIVEMAFMKFIIRHKFEDFYNYIQLLSYK